MKPDLISILGKGQTLVEVRLSEGSLVKVPQWKADGAPSLNAWVRQHAAAAELMKQPAAAKGTQPLQAPTADQCCGKKR
jgi:hypothetical protein